ncbi:hypothetical protein [Phenylobacterium deserti]|uniref:Uncharacterized protein n=1 Tax=Phenylobacterium deserti TaxID=1914756 RepID=A0A328AFB5_9CAUL|nr:hypothetical protein [Phenylobacterium deserti]RAK52104.1 hypothetical protein DJ018_13190 [Phenylobacterium deserti]
MPDCTGYIAPRTRTLIDSTCKGDAYDLGLPGPRDYREDSEGLQVTYDDRGPWPVLTITGSDGEVSFTGADAIRALSNACLKAEAWARAAEQARAA